ncbi:MAG: LamG domain-containing protein [Melioribacter sp.]|nr:LamG domain-containing protein [Melioribacter sp.]
MKKIFCSIFFSFILFFYCVIYPQQDINTIWYLNNPDTISGAITTPLTDKPVKIKSPFGNSLYFDGNDDGLLLNLNPISDWESFTIEIVFMPDSSSNLQHYEQRFLHIKNQDDSKRVLIETRLIKKNLWSLDTFIKSGNSRCTLIDTSIFHPTNRWFHVALTYHDGIMKHFVNGEQELCGKVDFQPFEKGSTLSIGVRQNKKSWFKGTIGIISFTNKELTPEKFLLLKEVNKVRL